MIDVTDDELFEICNALNTHASHFRNLAETRKAKKQTKDVWRTEADKLNAITCKLLEQRRIERMEDLIPDD
jgi:hypothetical protein